MSSHDNKDNKTQKEAEVGDYLCAKNLETSSVMKNRKVTFQLWDTDETATPYKQREEDQKRLPSKNAWATEGGCTFQGLRAETKERGSFHASKPWSLSFDKKKSFYGVSFNMASKEGHAVLTRKVSVRVTFTFINSKLPTKVLELNDRTEVCVFSANQPIASITFQCVGEDLGFVAHVCRVRTFQNRDAGNNNNNNNNNSKLSTGSQPSFPPPPPSCRVTVSSANETSVLCKEGTKLLPFTWSVDETGAKRQTLPAAGISFAASHGVVFGRGFTAISMTSVSLLPGHVGYIELPRTEAVCGIGCSVGLVSDGSNIPANSRGIRIKVATTNNDEYEFTAKVHGNYTDFVLNDRVKAVRVEIEAPDDVDEALQLSAFVMSVSDAHHHHHHQKVSQKKVPRLAAAAAADDDNDNDHLIPCGSRLYMLGDDKLARTVIGHKFVQKVRLQDLFDDTPGLCFVEKDLTVAGLTFRRATFARTSTSRRLVFLPEGNNSDGSSVTANNVKAIRVICDNTCKYDNDAKVVTHVGAGGTPVTTAIPTGRHQLLFVSNQPISKLTFFSPKSPLEGHLTLYNWEVVRTFSVVLDAASTK